MVFLEKKSKQLILKKSADDKKASNISQEAKSYTLSCQ